MSNTTESTQEPLLDSTVRLTVLGFDSVAIVTEEDIVINGIPVEFRAYFRKNHGGHWISTNLFAYRNDNQESWHPQHPATDNQVSKIYSACRELAETVTEHALIRGERLKQEREILSVRDQIRLKEEELDALKAVHHGLLIEEEKLAS